MREGAWLITGISSVHREMVERILAGRLPRDGFVHRVVPDLLREATIVVVRSSEYPERSPMTEPVHMGAVSFDDWWKTEAEKSEHTKAAGDSADVATSTEASHDGEPES